MARYCTRCGKDNLDDAAFCKNCGMSLSATAGAYAGPKPKKDDECFGTEEDKCFGIPNGAAIVGIIFGVLLIIAGIALFSGWSWSWNWFGAAILLLIGVLIVIGALYRRRR